MTSLTVLTLCMVGLSLGQGGSGGIGGPPISPRPPMPPGHPKPGGQRRRREAPYVNFVKDLQVINYICSDGKTKESGSTWDQLTPCRGSTFHLCSVRHLKEEVVTWDQLTDCFGSETKKETLKEIFQSYGVSLKIKEHPSKENFDMYDKSKDGKLTVA